MADLTRPPDSIFTIKAEIPDFGKLELFTDVVRLDEKGGAAVRFLYPDTNTIISLWKHIRDNLRTQDCCPYCDCPNGSGFHHCKICGGYLDFRDDLYLEKHLKETIPDRILRRIKCLGSDGILSAIRYFDSAFLEALDANNHVIVKTAKALDISRPTLYSLMKKAGIDRSQSRPFQ